jgi:hypothetical protein
MWKPADRDCSDEICRELDHLERFPCDERSLNLLALSVPSYVGASTAKRALERAVDECHPAGYVYTAAYALHGALGERAAALGDISKLLAASDDSGYWLPLHARAAIEAGELRTAAIDYLTLLHRNREDTLAAESLTRMYCELGRPDIAARLTRPFGGWLGELLNNSGADGILQLASEEPQEPFACEALSDPTAERSELAWTGFQPPLDVLPLAR